MSKKTQSLSVRIPAAYFCLIVFMFLTCNSALANKCSGNGFNAYGDFVRCTGPQSTSERQSGSNSGKTNSSTPSVPRPSQPVRVLTPPSAFVSSYFPGLLGTGTTGSLNNDFLSGTIKPGTVANDDFQKQRECNLGQADPEAKKSTYYVGKQFPSATSAGVANPYYVHLYTGANFGVSQKAVDILSPVVSSVDDAWTSGRSLSSQAWKDTGALRLAIRGVQGPEYGHVNSGKNTSAQQFKNYFEQALSFPDAQGIALDEFSAAPKNREKSRTAIPGLLELKCERPNYFVQAWTTHKSGLTTEPINLNENHAIADVITCEAYPDCDGKKTGTSEIDDCANEFNRLGLENKAVIGLSIGNKNRLAQCPRPTLSEFRSYIKTIRRKIPEAGLMLFGRFPYDTAAQAEDSAKNWIAPYLKIIQEEYHDKSPVVNDIAVTQNGGGNITIRANASPGPTGQQVQQYRFFVDNQVVAIQNGNPQLNIDLSQFGSGEHIITVHAIDGSSLAGVRQIKVTN